MDEKKLQLFDWYTKALHNDDIHMEKWLGVSINRTAHYEVEISIHMEWMKQENIDINIKSA